MSSATQAKERQYVQLAASLTRLSRAIGQTAVLFEQLQVDLDAMRTLSGLHAAQYGTWCIRWTILTEGRQIYAGCGLAGARRRGGAERRISG